MIETALVLGGSSEIAQAILLELKPQGLKRAVLAVRSELEAGSSTVGVRVQIEHISPTAVGGQITAEAHLEKVEGRRLIFHVSARDERGLIAAGKVTRVLINIERFLEKTR